MGKEKELKSKTKKVGNYEYVNVLMIADGMINGKMRKPGDVILVEKERAKRMIRGGIAGDTKEKDVDENELNIKLGKKPSGITDSLSMTEDFKIELNKK